MIALSDVALAHLAIGASRIPRSRRKRWLTDLARHIELGEPLKPLCRSAMRTRAYRRRIADGKVLLEIVADEINLVNMLVGTGLLDPSVADDRKAQAAAAEHYLMRDASPRDNFNSDSVRISLALRKRKPRGARFQD